MNFAIRSFGSIVNSKISEAAIYNEVKFRIERQLVREALLEINLFKKTTATWEMGEYSQKLPDFRYEIRSSGNDFQIDIFTDDLIWKFLNGGTSVRRATGSFINKTHYRELNSTSGSRKVTYINKNLQLPGIKAREWDKEVELIRWPLYKDNFRKLISRLGQFSITGRSIMLDWVGYVEKFL